MSQHINLPLPLAQVYIPNSSKNSDVGHPFGYLKASTTLQTVNLFVMPYNYPVLLPLLDDLFKTHRLKPTKEWRIQFDNYLRTMPPYYANVSVHLPASLLWLCGCMYCLWLRKRKYVCVCVWCVSCCVLLLCF